MRPTPARQTAIRRLVLVFAVASPLTLTGCDQKKADQDAQPPSPAADVAQGPIRHETLTEEQLGRIDKIHQVFADVDGKSHDKLIDGFKREEDVDHELGVWEQMEKSYQRYVDAHSPTPEARKEVFKIVLMHSMASEDDVLERLKLNVLSKEDALEVMREP